MADLTPNNREEYWLKGMVDGQTTLEPNKRREYWYKEIVDAIGSGGGGGTGGGVLTVNVDPSTRVCDKTAKEIADALNTQIVRFKATITQEGATNVLYALVESVASNGVLYGITYSDIKGNFPYDGFESPAYSANDYPIMKEI